MTLKKSALRWPKFSFFRIPICRFRMVRVYRCWKAVWESGPIYPIISISSVWDSVRRFCNPGEIRIRDGLFCFCPENPRSLLLSLFSRAREHLRKKRLKTRQTENSQSLTRIWSKGGNGPEIPKLGPDQLENPKFTILSWFSKLQENAPPGRTLFGPTSFISIRWERIRNRESVILYVSVSIG